MCQANKAECLCRSRVESPNIAQPTIDISPLWRLKKMYPQRNLWDMVQAALVYYAKRGVYGLDAELMPIIDAEQRQPTHKPMLTLVRNRRERDPEQELLANQ